MTEYIKTELKQPVTVQNIITVHYFEYTKNFAFTGEAHDFWEIVFADKGDLYINHCCVRGRCISTGRWNSTISAVMGKRRPTP